MKAIKSGLTKWVKIDKIKQDKGIRGRVYGEEDDAEANGTDKPLHAKGT